jgi:uncharacterized protein YjbI with pentapeptide repeats
MANKEHMQTLITALASQSMASWNRLRLENPSIRPDLLGVELVEANLSFANLSNADIRHADLSRANLHHANLRHADLSSTNLQQADLSEADLSGSILKGADLSGAILRDAKLRKANLIGASFKNVNLRGVNLAGVLLDPEAIGGKKIRSSRGVSNLEKFALGLFAHAKGKEHPRVNGGTKPHRSLRHI